MNNENNTGMNTDDMVRLKEFYEPLPKGFTGCSPPDVAVVFDEIVEGHSYSTDINYFPTMCRNIGLAHGTEAYYVRESNRILKEVTAVMQCPLEDVPLHINSGRIAAGIARKRLEKGK